MAGRFPLEEDERLIEEVRKYSAIYDHEHRDYKDFQIKENIWCAISQSLRKNKEDCKKRWRSIRDSYKRLLRAGKLDTESDGTSKPYKWPLCNYLSFLRNFSDERRNTSNIIGENLTQDKIDDSENKEVHDYLSDHVQEEYDSKITLSGSGFRASSSKGSRNKRKFIEEIPQLLQENKKSRKEILGALLESYIKEKKEDEIDIFYKSIAMSIKRLPPHLIMQAKLQHLQIVNDLEFKFLTQQRRKYVTKKLHQTSGTIE